VVIFCVRKKLRVRVSGQVVKNFGEEFLVYEQHGEQTNKVETIINNGPLFY